MPESGTRCGWKIRWAFGQDARCDRPAHMAARVIDQRPDGRFSVALTGDPQHRTRLPNRVTGLTWQAGDRREFTGDWPGPCPLLERGLGQCTLPFGHHGRCAP